MNPLTALLVGTLALGAAGQVTLEPSMLTTTTPATSLGWTAEPLFTVSEAHLGYQPPGKLDGIGVFALGPKRAAVIVNHELSPDKGYPYALANGTTLTGARASYFLVEREVDELTGTATLGLLAAGPAYFSVRDRQGLDVTRAAQINEQGHPTNGLNRLCSATFVVGGTYGFSDYLFLTGEETSGGHGGTEWVLDPITRTLHAAPALGRGAWENASPLDTGDPTEVALLMGDDTPGAPLYLYVGKKGGLGDGSFLDRNGLALGKLYAWKADSGDLSPQTFLGQDQLRAGQFVEVTVQDPAMAGQAGHDAFGYADASTLQAEADALGCFSFSRPEDVATNPLDGTQAVFASTGRSELFPADTWGTVYVVDVDFADLSADLLIVHDADGLPVPDLGVRNPDNVDWADDGKLYVQEDKSISAFGATSGVEASIWQVDPVTRRFRRIAEVDRSSVAPAGSTDKAPADLGNWETSGILDVTAVFQTFADERLLLSTVQAHSIQDGPIGGDALLDEGGQLVFLSKRGQ